MAEESLYSLSEEIRREERERQETIRLNLANQLQYEPDRSRRILAVSAATGLPNEVADADLDNLEQLVQRREFNLEKWRAQSPAWTSYASENPYHLSVLKDDQENMGTFERAFKQIGLGWDSTWAQVELAQIRARHIDRDEREGDETRLKELRQLLVEHEFGAENAFVRFLVKNAKMAGPTLTSIGRGLETGLATSMVFGGAVALAGQAPPLVALPEELVTVPAASLLGFKVGFTAGTTSSAFNLERGFAYDEYLEMGVDKETARLAANSVGLVNAALETLAIGKAVKYVPWLRGSTSQIGKKVTGEVLAKPSVARASAALVGRFGEVLGTEVVTEVMQETVTAVTGDLIRKDGQGVPLTWDSYVDRMANVATETMQGAFIMSSFGPSMSYYADLRRVREAERMKSVYLALGDASRDSSTRENLPAKYREFVERMTADGPIDAFDIDVDRFDEYFQSKDLNPDEIANDLGIDAEELAAARTLGGTIAMPTVEYAQKITPTEHHSALVPDLKVGEAMSAREAELFRKNNPEIVAAMEKSIEPALDDSVRQSIINDITGQLVALGYDPETAATSAEVLLGIQNLAERMGMDPRELYEQRLASVKGALPEGVQAREDVDMSIDPLLDRLRAKDIPTQRDIFGESLVDFIVARGGLQPDPELDARDFLKEMVAQGKMGAVQLTGDTLDGLAEAAFEAGYIPARDPDMLLEAIDRELRGEPQFGTRVADTELQELASKLEEAAQFFEMEGIDLGELSNIEVRKLLEGVTTLEQIDTDELRNLTELVERLVSAQDKILADAETIQPDTIDTLLSRLMVSLPGVYAEQDLSGVTFTDTVRVAETGETVEVTKSAQKTFDRAVKRRNVLKQLMDCVDGT